MAKQKYAQENLPTGHRALAFAVLTTGLEDAVKGDPGAREWLDSKPFEHWCDLCDMNPDYLRRQLAPLLPAVRQKRPRVGGNKAGSGRQFTPDELAKAVEIHDVYACDNCGADEREPHVWPDAADIERDRAVYDEWLARRDEWAQGKVKESAR